METLIAISRWLAKQHVVTWCVQQEGELWCANAFYLFDAQKVAFYILTEEKTRHAQMSGPQAAVAGTVNGQPKTVALIRGVQFKGEIRRLEGEESDLARKAYNRRFPVARMLSAPVWEIRLDEIFSGNVLQLAAFHRKGLEYTCTRSGNCKLLLVWRHGDERVRIYRVPFPIVVYHRKFVVCRQEIAVVVP